jgi:hypothetical protein
MSSQPRSERLEPGGVHTGWVSLLAAGLMLLLLASVGALYVAFVAFTPANRTPAVRQFPQPRLEADRGQTLHALLEQQRRELSDYRWVDSDHTVVAIPIERAMQIIAARGDKAFAPIANTAGAPAEKPAGEPSGGSEPPKTPPGSSSAGGQP